MAPVGNAPAGTAPIGNLPSDVSSSGSSSKIVWIVVAIVVVAIGVGAFFMLSGGDESEEREIIEDEGIDSIDVVIQEENAEETVEEESGEAPETKTFVMTGENFKFVMDGVENPDIVVNEGDTVRIEFTSTAGTHNWVVDEFDSKTGTVSSGGDTFVEFVADQTGTFEYYCGIGSHRSAGMKGNLIVQ